MTNFWTQLENSTIKDKSQIEHYLTKKLGQPTTEIQTNLLSELTNKINSYYFQEEPQHWTTYSLFGFITEIQEKKFKEGKNKGQIFYNLKLGGTNHRETLQARKELLPEEKWQQITKLAILGKNLVFKYRKWITNKQVLDFYEKEGKGKNAK